MTIGCTRARDWLTSAATDALPPDELCAHVAGCGACRADLAAALGRGNLPMDGSCDMSRDDIAAFVDAELASGAAAAAEELPHAWRHILTCAECAEEYDLVRGLRERELHGELAFPALRDTARPANAPLRARLALIPELLADLLGARRSLGLAWGHAADGPVFAEEQRSGRRIALRCAQQDGERWSLMVEVDPPLCGRASLEGADLSANFDERGRAEIAGLPLALLDEAVPLALTVAEDGE